jgi:hypothetical protein
MSDRAREALELRAILVSARAAAAHTGETEMPALRATADGLLARLQEPLMRNGGHPEVLAALGEARRAVRDD